LVRGSILLGVFMVVVLAMKIGGCGN
jgi:hypothetical protein